ncbi:PLP-dependent transferase [Neoconidiobolus thromboides FSU 785]|nr:PLP-dependent transferase [Neoconidiobolus thromboides FSU 785]
MLNNLLNKRLNKYLILSNNTEVGKTIFSNLLVRGALKLNQPVLYLKPVQTGYPEDSDTRHILKYNRNNPLLTGKTLFKYPNAVSPHLARDRIVEDEEVLQEIELNINSYNKKLDNNLATLFIESAGGVLSPTLSGGLQADLYRSLRYPVILIGDSRLGGISTTISSYESLKIRGYDVIQCCLFQDVKYENDEYLKQYFNKEGIQVHSIEKPPSMLEDKIKDEKNLENYFIKNEDSFVNINQKLMEYYEKKYAKLNEMKDKSKDIIWWPFTQHQTLKSIGVIESAYKDDIKFHNSEDNSLSKKQDSNASWWTQGLGHGNYKIGMEMVYANSKYGHLLFPENIHEPAYDLSHKLLSTVGKGWANKVFFSDNGSTGIEVAIKMALTSYKKINQLKEKDVDKLIVIGLKGGYHGDTIGAMDASNPSVYNKKVDWYSGKGVWLDSPNVKIKNNQIVVKLEWNNKEYVIENNNDNNNTKDNLLNSLFNLNQRMNEEDELYQIYNNYINEQYNNIPNKKEIAALLIEPVIMGAGGMILVDPLFQRLLINKLQHENKLIIIDEVFTGFYRLSKMSATQLLNIQPDISIFSKALTGGNLPLSVTLANDKVYNAFLSEDKIDSLLHGHSYTAYPIGCQAALASLKEYEKLFGRQDENNNNNNNNNSTFITDLYDTTLTCEISKHEKVDGVISIGSLLAVYLKTENRNYASNLAKQVIEHINKVNDGYFLRPLGNVIYYLGSHQSEKNKLVGFQTDLLKALDSI